MASDSIGDINVNLALGAGLSDSCASCHGRPRGSAGFGGDVVTRLDSRDAPHLFGLGLKEMLADEITSDLRLIRAAALSQAQQTGRTVSKALKSKGIDFGTITARQDGTVDVAGVQGVDADLRVKPFFSHGGTTSIREFVAGALNDEMGLQAVDSDLTAAHNGARIITPAGMVLDGSKDIVKAPLANDAYEDPDGDGIANEIPTSIVDHMEFYLLNYFKPATYQQTASTSRGLDTFKSIGCAKCHIPNLQIEHDRRVADVETVYDPANGGFNNLFATAKPLFAEVADNSGFPPVKRPSGSPFLVKNIFTDFKRHDLGPNFYERNFDLTVRTQFLTTPLWGVGSTAPYGHDGRSMNLMEVILRHGGEAESAKQEFVQLSSQRKSDLLEMLNSLILFPPDDTPSNLDPGDKTASGYPQNAHGSIKLTVLFNNPMDPE